eukprot:2016378-Rhodomonas_salina.2
MMHRQSAVESCAVCYQDARVYELAFLEHRQSELSECRWGGCCCRRDGPGNIPDWNLLQSHVPPMGSWY